MTTDRSDLHLVLLAESVDASRACPTADAVVVAGAVSETRLSHIVASFPGVPVIVAADVDDRTAEGLLAAAASDVLPAKADVAAIERSIRRYVARRPREKDEKPAERRAHAAQGPRESQMPSAEDLNGLRRLAGGLAHEFNNILQIIGSQAERLHQVGGTGGDMGRRVDTIRLAVTRAAAVTQQLRTISHQEVLLRSTQNLNDLLSESLPALRYTVGDTVEVFTRCDHGLPLVNVDATQIHEVLEHLAIRASEAMPDGGTLTISTDRLSVGEHLRLHKPWLPAGEYVRLQMADTGRGIEQSMLPHIFEPFALASDPRNHEGLGLTSVYASVTQNDGFVWVDSSLARGTEVTILLPVPSEDRYESSVPAAPADAATSSLPERPRILLVEDEEEVRALLSELLGECGMVVTAAGDAEAGLLKAVQQKFDLVLSDIVLPGRSGPEMAREIRRVQPGTPILFMSGHTADRCAPDDLDSARAFLQKPFPLDILVQRIRELLQLKKV